MFMAIGAVSTAIDALQSLGSSLASSTQSTGQSQTSTSPFSLPSDASTPGTSAGGGGFNSYSAISPQTMSQLLAAQSQSGATTSASLDPSQALQKLFSQIDTNGDGQITKSEFENALGAGGTNVAAADHVFNQLDTNGDGTVSLSELQSALQGAGHHGGHHHFHADASDGTGDSSSSAGSSSTSTNTDPLLQALAGTTSTSSTNSNGSTTTTLTFPDGSTVSMVTPAAGSSSSSATSSYNFIEQMIQREAQAASSSLPASLSVNV